MLESVFNELHSIERKFGGDILFYRGHSDSNWSLLPSIARRTIDISNIESVAYYDFFTRAGNLLPQDESGWSQIFAMQHHGIPTRLLDWTTTFGVALFFAVREGLGDAAIWVLDPFALNAVSWTSNTLPTPGELKANYYETFIMEEKKNPAKIVAISPTRINPRVLNQRAAFTLHVELSEPLEKMYPDVVSKITIPKELRTAVKSFLRIAGISEYSIFPDLDGLARDILSEHFKMP